MKKTFFGVLLVLIVTTYVQAQTTKESQRLLIAREFILAIKHNEPNELIMKKFVKSEQYSQVDSIKRMADKWLDDMRKHYDNIPGQDIVSDRYADHQDAYSVQFKPLNAEQSGNGKRRLEISVTNFSKVVEKIDPEDVYVVRTGSKFKEDDAFIVFTNDNKILSFAGFRVGPFMGMIQF